jgi:hypothetical protein
MVRSLRFQPLVAWALALMCSMPARAHAPPIGLALKWASSAEDALPLIVANRGLVFADRVGGGMRFSLRCAEGFGAGVAGVPGVFFEQADSLLLSVYSGTSRTSDRACTLQPAAGLVGTSFGSMVQDLTSPNRVYVTSRTTEATAALFVSEDYARSWSPRFTNHVDEYYDSLLVAPSDARRLYASGRRLDRVQKKLQYLSSVSLDAGETWRDTPFVTKLTPFAVHPRTADVVFAYESTDTLETVFRILRSDDMGSTYASILEGVPQPLALTASSAGTSLWLGLSGAGGQGGLYRSEDDGMHFERVHADTVQQASCLAERQGRLWLCANMAPNQSGVWFSDDEGDSFQKFMTFADVTDPVPCDGEAQALCARDWRDFDAELHPPIHDAGLPPNADSASAAAPAPSPANPPHTRHASGCQLASSRAGSTLHWYWAVAACWAALRRRRLPFLRR